MKKQDVISLIKDFSSENMPVATIYYSTTANISYNQSELKSLVKQLKESHKDIYENVEKHLAEADLVTRLESHFIIVANADKFFVAPINVDVENFTHVGPAPMVLPLMEMVTRPSEFIVMSLNGDNINFLEYADGKLKKMTELPGKAPLTLNMGIGEEVNGGDINPNVPHGGKMEFHDHNMLEQERKIDQTDYYRVIDLYLGKNFKDMPIVLKGVAKNISLFRSIMKHSKDLIVEDVQIEKNIDEIPVIEADVLEQFKAKYIKDMERYLDRECSEKHVVPFNESADELIEAGRVGTVVYKKHHDQWKLADILEENPIYAELLVKGIDIKPLPGAEESEAVAILRY